MSRFARYLGDEILPLYAAGLAALLMLLLGSFLLGSLADILARGVPARLVASFLLFKLPLAASSGIPLALLFAGLLGITRLAQDGEIKAALLLGLGPRRFLLPVLALGAAVSVLAFVNNEVVVPWAEERAREAQKDILLLSPATFVEAGSFFTDGLGRSIYIGELGENGRFENAVVIDPGRGSGAGGPAEISTAERGTLDPDGGIWTLEGVRFVRFRQSRPVMDARAEQMLLPVRELAADGVGSQELTTLPLRELWARIESDRSRNSAEWTALHRTFAEPVAAVAFALFALAVGLFTFRYQTPLGLVAVLFLTFLYYATWSVSNLLGAQGTIPAWLAGWTPVGLYAGAGAVLLALSWRR